MEAADVDSMSSSARSHVNDEGDVATGSADMLAEGRLQLDLSLSGSEDDGSPMERYGLEDDEFYDHGGDLVGEALGGADRLTESDLTLRAASLSSATNVRDERHVAIGNRQHLLTPPQLTLTSGTESEGNSSGMSYMLHNI